MDYLKMTNEEIKEPYYMVLMHKAIESEGGIDKLSKLMDMQERWEKNESKKSFFKAFANFQNSISEINKDSKGQNSKFASLGKISKEIKKPLYDNGLSFRFESFEHKKDDWITIRCILSHLEGYSVTSELSGPMDKSGSKKGNDMQAMGSSSSYLRRYTLIACAGLIISNEDDDGYHANGKNFIEKKLYPEKDFQRNLPIWSNLIESKRNTPDEIIFKLEANNVNLSESQKKEILSIKKLED